MLGTGGPWVGQETTGILGAADRMPKYRSLVRLSCLLPLQQAQGVECVSLPLFDSLGHGVGPLYPQGSEVTNSKSRDVYKLPPPTAPGPPGDTCRSRIPSPLQPETQGAPDDEVGVQGWPRSDGAYVVGLGMDAQPGLSVHAALRA